MAFKRTSFKGMVKSQKEFFASTYRLPSKVNNWKLGSECYILMLGLDNGFYETPTHTIQPHKIGDKTIGFRGSNFATTIKCKGFDENGDKVDSLCCKLYQLEKERGVTAANRCINYTSTRIQIPILILGNSLKEEKSVYPVSCVSILNSLRSEKGLNFSYLDMASSSFEKDIIKAYAKKLKEDGIIDYETDESSDEFLEDIRQRLTKTVVKVKAVEKAGFKGLLKEYSFFPFENPSIASKSPEGERTAIINYTKHKGIMEKVNEYLTLFDLEVDNIFPEWNEKDLQEYYNSFIGVDLKTGIKEEAEEVKSQEKVEIMEHPFEQEKESSELTDEDKSFLESLNSDDFVEEEPVKEPVKEVVEKPKVEIKKVTIPTEKKEEPKAEEPSEEWEKVEDVAQVDTTEEDFNFDLDDDEEFFKD